MTSAPGAVGSNLGVTGLLMITVEFCVSPLSVSLFGFTNGFITLPKKMYTYDNLMSSMAFQNLYISNCS